MFIEELAEDARKQLESISGEKVFFDSGMFGDFSTSLPLRVAKKTGKNPDDVAKEWTGQIHSPGLIAKPEKGFINFFLTDDALLYNLKNITKFKPENRVAVIDYSSPNIAKPFSIAHMRSTVIGDSLKRMLEMLGWKVHGINFVGDWGTQFSKLLVAYEKWPPTDLEKEPIKQLLELYVRFHKEADDELNEEAKKAFEKLENGDKEATRLWTRFKELSMKEFQKTYDLLEISGLEEAGESMFVDKGKELADELLKKGIAETSEGAIVVPIEGKPPLLLRKSNGTTIYASRDLAAGIWRYEKFHPDLMLYVVGNDQKLHFQQLFAALKKIGIKADMKHISFGLLKLPEGKMSTRKGKVVFLQDVLNKAMDKVRNIMSERGVEDEEDIHIIGVGAVKFSDLKNNRMRDAVFDWNALSFEGETGPYVQYSAVRAKRIGEKFGKGAPGLPKEFKDLSRLLIRFRLVLKEAIHAMRPDILANYALELSKKFNELYVKEKMGGVPEREWIAERTFKVLETSLYLLGIRIPNKM